MSELRVARWTGGFGFAAAALLAVEFTLRVVSGGTPPPFADTVHYADFVAKTSTSILTIILVDMVIMACVLVFLAGFRHLVCAAGPDYEWLATLIFGAGLVLVAVTLVADSLEAGTALDTIGRTPDPTVIRALSEGYFLLYGSIGAVLLVVMSLATGYVTLVTKMLPRWTGWVAFLVAVLNVLAVPSIYGGTSISGLGPV